MRLAGIILAIALLASCGAAPMAPDSARTATVATFAKECAAGQMKACTNLMTFFESASDRDEHVRLACARDAPVACAFLGNFYFMRSHYPLRSERVSILREMADEMYKFGCNHGSKAACTLYSERKPKAAKSISVASQPLKHPTKEVAIEDCKRLLAAAPESARAVLRNDLRACLAATVLGATDQELQVLVSQTEHAASSSGDAHPVQTTVNWQRSSIAKVIYCMSENAIISEIRVVTSSGDPLYDRKIFKTLQAWRYKGFMVDGKPKRACTQISFVYIPDF